MKRAILILGFFNCVAWLATTTLKLEASPESTAASADESTEQEPAPPADQTYVGVKKCSACHFNQFLIWRKDTHSKAFDNLPAKYKSDESCVKCHTTGFGHETGFKTAADKDLAGITCESCHGPGSAHAEVCASLPKGGKLTAEQEKAARDSIWRMLPKNVCVTCHKSKGHVAHPAYDK
ncbi:MAG: hypothetical protein KDA96_01665 [Planctomycetaceae bacterium]|nr:hypothetical protein [Planctomycetaceae bacterium]